MPDDLTAARERLALYASQCELQAQDRSVCITHMFPGEKDIRLVLAALTAAEARTDAWERQRASVLGPAREVVDKMCGNCSMGMLVPFPFEAVQELAARAEAAEQRANEALLRETFGNSERETRLYDHLCESRSLADSLAQALRGIEWEGEDGGCPLCGADEGCGAGPRGHLPECAVGAALAAYDASRLQAPAGLDVLALVRDAYKEGALAGHVHTVSKTAQSTSLDMDKIVPLAEAFIGRRFGQSRLQAGDEK